MAYLLSMQAETLIFDLDGTLWDTNRVCARAWNDVLTRFGVDREPVTEREIRAVAGLSHRDAVGRVLAGLDETLLDRISVETQAADNRALEGQGGSLFAGVSAWIPRLAARYPLMIVSNCQSGYIEIFRRTSGLDGSFVDHECWGNTGWTKARNLGAVVARNRAKLPVFVGDTEGDRVAARANGLPFLHAAYGFGHVDEADATLRCFEDLPRLLGI